MYAQNIETIGDKEMTLYELIYKVDTVLTPRNHALFDFILRTTDDNGTFLRSRCVDRLDLFPDREIGKIEWVVVAFQQPFNERDLIVHNHFPKTNLQVYFNNDLRTLDEAIEINKNLGFPHVFAIRI